MEAHTPGPWEVDIDSSDRWQISTGQMVVALLVGDFDFHENEANARLIAAAPELLAALKLIADAAYGTDTPKLRETARIAIAKAEGRS